MESSETPTSLSEKKQIDESCLYDLIEEFTLLPGAITDKNVTPEAFRAIYGSPEAASAENIVYVYLAEKPIPRVKGASRIVYIGETEKSFKKRNLSNAKCHATSAANGFKYRYIAEHYGPIRIATSPYQRFVDPAQHSQNTNLRRKAEGQLLWWYFLNHCEYPPVNYTKTKVRNRYL